MESSAAAPPDGRTDGRTGKLLKEAVDGVKRSEGLHYGS